MMRGLVILVQVLVWLLLLRLLARTFAAFLKGLRGPGAAPRTAPRGRPQVKAPEDLVLDRVCHSHVPRSRALSARVSGRDEWFCSEACRERALATVARAS